MTIHKAKDNSFKVIFNEPELFIDFLKNFIKLDILNNITPADIETEYEKEANKKSSQASSAKDFKYPPVLPIIFYDGTDEWTAETNFANKTELNDIFQKYIPKFEYELVDLNKYNEHDLTRFGDALSLILLIDKIKTADGMSLLNNLPPDYIEKLKVNTQLSHTKIRCKER
ncbi:MAG: Rpn family recombination-promoting nuclease/putative transposase [Prevotellaceae bacterium]|jgi:hypothetical protein|nr:Rpn family recombination-promoting nuclease/putative transposase [Prevotellaceae bacterium]